jgi:cyclohexyl-isocyanide hydratase
MSTTLKIGFLIYPGLTPLDAVGPAQVLGALPNAEIHMIWKDKQPVVTDVGFSINPTVSMSECPDLDVICVPGGGGQTLIMEDQQVLDFLKYQGEQAKYVTSVCSGSLLLGAAGLLNGYKATSHWAVLEYLPLYGAEPVANRVVRDRNRFTGGGVTAGIDFGLTLAAELAGEDVAKAIQLRLEYDPKPPFNAGSPDAAGPILEANARALFEQWISQAGSTFPKLPSVKS